MSLGLGIKGHRGDEIETKEEKLFFASSVIFFVLILSLVLNIFLPQIFIVIALCGYVIPS
jgi:hypothetical protein